MFLYLIMGKGKNGKMTHILSRLVGSLY